jgi:hypothetical protein
MTSLVIGDLILESLTPSVNAPLEIRTNQVCKCVGLLATLLLPLEKPSVRQCACFMFHNFRIDGAKIIEYRVVFIPEN